MMKGNVSAMDLLQLIILQRLPYKSLRFYDLRFLS